MRGHVEVLDMPHVLIHLGVINVHVTLSMNWILLLARFVMLSVHLPVTLSMELVLLLMFVHVMLVGKEILVVTI